MGMEQSHDTPSDALGDTEESVEQMSKATRIHTMAAEVDLSQFGSPPPPRTVRAVDGVPDAFIIDNVLTAAECEAMIALSEAAGYGLAPITTSAGPVMSSEIRNNKRVMMDINPAVLAEIAARCEGCFPETVTFAPCVWRIKTGSATLNERFRFYRYAAHETFKPHFDGAFVRSRSEKSMLTFIVYLNDGFEGGGTTFFPEGRTNFFTRGVASPVVISPRRGSALVFFHDGPSSPFHEGSPHSSSDMYKYVMRSDIMYQREVIRPRPEDG